MCGGQRTKLLSLNTRRCCIAGHAERGGRIQRALVYAVLRARPATGSIVRMGQGLRTGPVTRPTPPATALCVWGNLNVWNNCRLLVVLNAKSADRNPLVQFSFSVHHPFA